MSLRIIMSLINKERVGVCLAHVWWTEITSMRRFDIIMVGANYESPFFINIARVCSDLREAIPNPMMLQNCFNKESICIAHNLQLTPEHNSNAILGVSIIIYRGKENPHVG